MSGPITAIILANPVAALLSAAGIRAAQAVYEGYAAAAELQHQHEQRNGIRDSAQSDAQQQGNSALQEQEKGAEAAFEQLLDLAQRLGVTDQVRATRPAPPLAGSTDALAAYVRALHSLSADLRAILLTEAALQTDKFTDQGADLALPAATPRSLAQRLLQRIADLGDVPQQIRSVALELDATLPGARANLLATELRARIQAHVQALQQQQVQQATATIVERSLKDLGYQVEEVGSTLFVEGGVVHFRKMMLAGMRAAAAEAQEGYRWLDPARGIVRLPTEAAFSLAVREWQNPVQAKAHLAARVERATRPLPDPRP